MTATDELKVGDTVKVIVRNSIFYGNKGKIVGISPTGAFKYKCNFDGTHNSVSYASHELERVDDA